MWVPNWQGATGNEINMDMLAWYIDPSKGHAGFSPHRDRQPDDSPSTFRRDGSAKYATIWIPFTGSRQPTLSLEACIVRRYMHPCLTYVHCLNDPQTRRLTTRASTWYRGLTILATLKGMTTQRMHQTLSRSR